MLGLGWDGKGGGTSSTSDCRKFLFSNHKLKRPYPSNLVIEVEVGVIGEFAHASVFAGGFGKILLKRAAVVDGGDGKERERAELHPVK